MKREVVWSATARDDYLEIILYTAERNPDAALRLAQRIDRVVATWRAWQQDAKDE